METHPTPKPSATASEKLSHFTLSKPFKITICIVGSLLVLLAVFGAGVEVGFHKASHSFQWGENYHRNFGGPRDGFMGNWGRQDPGGAGFGRGGFGEEDYMNGNGVFGKILKIDGQTLSIQGIDGVEQIVLVSNDTSLRQNRDTIKLADLKADDYIVVIGEPNPSGQIQAKLIRVMPTPPFDQTPPSGQPSLSAPQAPETNPPTPSAQPNDSSTQH
jgi:hypothetical protein